MHKKKVVQCLFMCLILSILQCGTKKVYLRIKADNNNYIQRTIKAVTLTLNVSKKNAAKSMLIIENNGKKPIHIVPSDITLTIAGIKAVLEAVHNYETFIELERLTALEMCQGSSDSYTCADMSNNFFKNLKGNGFKYGTIDPGQSAKGLIAFDVPTLFNEPATATRFDTMNEKRSYRIKGTIKVRIKKDGNYRNVTFPIALKIMEDFERVEHPLRYYFQ